MKFNILHFLKNSILEVFNYKSKNQVSESELRLKLKKETNRKRLDRVKIQRITDLQGKYRSNKKQGVSMYTKQTAFILANSK